MSKPVTEVEVTYWLNLYRLERTGTIYANQYLSKMQADHEHEHCRLVFSRPRLGNKAHKVVYWEAEDGV
jgi:hypothetical protein